MEVGEGDVRHFQVMGDTGPFFTMFVGSLSLFHGWKLNNGEFTKMVYDGTSEEASIC